MYCKRCNKKFGEEYVVCPECGEILAENSEGGTTINNGTLSGGYGNSSNQDLPQRDGKIIEDKSVMYIILSVAMLFCCNQICGIISLIFSIIASNSFSKGDYEDAAQKWKVSKVTLWIGIIINIVLVVTTIIMFSAGVASALSNLVQMT